MWFSKKQTYPISHLTGTKPIAKMVACVKRGGMDEQRIAIQAVAESEAAKVVSEVTSIDQAIQLASRRGAVIVIGWEGDLDTLRALTESRSEFIVCHNPRAARLNADLSATIDAHERQLISEQMRVVLAEKKAAGVKLGAARPGHWKGREHILRRAQKKGAKNAAKAKRERWQEKDRPIIGTINELQETHNLSQIADELNKKGFTTAAGKPFTKVAVFRAIERSKVSA